MADAGRFRQAGGPGRVNQQGPIVDGDVATLVRRKRAVIERGKRDVDRASTAGIAVGPDLCFRLQVRRRAVQRLIELVRDDNLSGLCDIDAMRERLADELGVDQRDHAADATDPEPGRDIVDAVRHDQRDSVALGHTGRAGPPRITIDAFREPLIVEACVISDQRDAIGLALRPIVDDVGE
ncbi:hypothetical protein ACVWWR_002155 [Bradyrhizobium sp. LM3.2]